MNHDSAPRPSKPRTRSAARIEGEAEEARKRRESGLRRLRALAVGHEAALP
ncbi:Putative cyclin-A3-1 [Zea mays]|uniref:Putative cyclin-A3-1 n=1 Tax=Zea mays TaxID=4577 RepID=A0A1D6PHV2_MAIZE|nr:Putative cyclin-A3-1 [Zea mays]